MKRPFIFAAIAFIVVLIFAGWRLSLLGQQDDATPSDEQVSLGAQFASALNSSQSAKAIELGQQLVANEPRNATHAYNLGCAYARAGQSASAIASLQSAADLGFVFLATMQRDEDLVSLRSEPGYLKALQGVKANSDRELESFKREVADVEPIIVLPPKHDPEQPAALIVALHPTGGTAKDFVALWRGAAAKIGAILVAPQGRMQAGGGWRWGKVEHGEWLTLHAIEQAKAKHKINDQRVVVTGFSEGGSVSFVVALRNPQAVAAAIPMCGEYVPEVSPVVKTPDGERSPRICIITGEFDRDVATNRAAHRDLEAAGYTAVLREFQGMGHELPPNHPEQFAAALEWVLRGDRE